MTEAEYEALYTTLYRLERRWLPPTIPDNSVHHAYDPLPLSMFLDGMRVAAQYAVRGKRFLDIGCGVGTKLAFMFGLGWEVAGIERHEPYATAARELIPEAQITVADVREVETFDADVVYLYRPMVSDDDEDAVERHVISRMAGGTVLFLPVRDQPAVAMERVAAHVWVR